MLKTLASNQTIAANGSATYTYAPQSFQKLIVRAADADWELMRVTVQIGSETICNGVSMLGLTGLATLQANISVNAGGTTGMVVVDFGCHIMDQNENLYVTLNSSAEVTAVDVAILVDNSLAEVQPLKVTNYSDNTFTSDNCLMAVGYDASVGDLANVTDSVEIKTEINSTTPEIQSGVSFHRAESLAPETDLYALLNKNGVPMKTTYNYTSSTMDNIVVVEACYSNSKKRAKQSQFAQRTIEVSKANYRG